MNEKMFYDVLVSIAKSLRSIDDTLKRTRGDMNGELRDIVRESRREKIRNKMLNKSKNIKRTV